MKSIRELASFMAELYGYDGYMIGKISYDRIQNHFLPANGKVFIEETKKKEKYAVIEITEKYKEDVIQKLTVTLIKSGKNDKSNDGFNKENHATYFQKDSVRKTEFMIESRDLEEYLLVSKDYNSIHKSQKPVVPGLLLLEKVLELEKQIYQEKTDKKTIILFHNPVYIKERILLYENKNKMIALTKREDRNILLFEWRR